MKLSVIGAGYVGLVSGSCFADLGYTVTCIEINSEKLSKLNKGIVPFYEPGLETIIKRHTQSKRLTFSNNISDSIAESNIIIAAVGTPSNSDGSCNLNYLWEAAKQVFELIKKNSLKSKTWITKSTVSVGTAEKLIEIRKQMGLSEKHIQIVSNPEFLREGSAVHDFFHPDRIVIGSENDDAKACLDELYRPLHLRDVPIVHTHLQTAELAKYASNSFLATKISFINEIGNLCEAYGADVKDISKIMGMDQRIGKYFLHPGPGYGGSCFPKDVKALSYLFQQANIEGRIAKATQRTNTAQQERPFNIINTVFDGALANKTIAILGLSFKANTDDIRESSALVLINQLLAVQSNIKVFDPAAMENTKSIYDENLIYCNDCYDAANAADALIIMTEWNSFRRLDFQRLKKTMNNAILFDFRKIYTAQELEKEGFRYYILGRTALKKLKSIQNSEHIHKH